ncbi:MAG: CsgG/HfaB family protein, partial [Nitrospinota bacterium]
YSLMRAKSLVDSFFCGGVSLLLFSCASPSKYSSEIPLVDRGAGQFSSAKQSKFLPHQVAPAIVKELLDQLPQTEGIRTGVLDFTDLNGRESYEGKHLAKKITSELTSQKRVAVVEREYLPRILEEQKLNMSGVTTSVEQEAGTVFGVDVLITGTVTRHGGVDRITAKITDVKTGEIYGATAFNAENELTAKPKGREKAKTPQPKIGIRSVPSGLREELKSLKRQNPVVFKEVKKVLRRLNSMKKKHPKTFVLATEPPGSKKLQKVRRDNPKKFARLQKIRRKIGFAVWQLPSLKPKLLRERRVVMKTLSGKKRKRG